MPTYVIRHAGGDDVPVRDTAFRAESDAEARSVFAGHITDMYGTSPAAAPALKPAGETYELICGERTVAGFPEAGS